jgi:isoleucyl-tRNA synthetase
LRKFILLYWNIYSFFVTYANADNWSPEKLENSDEILDKWILSEYNQLLRNTQNRLDKFDIVGVARKIQEFNNDLSTWYLRRSRKRRDEKFYSTLYKVLMGLTKIIAPFAPFITEEIYQNLKKDIDPESVHLCDWPNLEKDKIDQKLNNQRMELN